ncbi:DDE-type integrase/transposase/recombinase [Ferrimonas lipolytica]|uniref:Transposase family protein n=1 Tax=Ferrimonas lipolytica TaxID=2724191 RepID=A0A6H1UHC0_9GAMM|nr:transposase family protein [Ferrimonas lipolytica]
MKKRHNLFYEMEIKRPEQALVSDTTYVRSDEGVHYLSLVTDAYSRRIMGYELSHEMKAEDTAKALNRAVRSWSYSDECIHHFA